MNKTRRNRGRYTRKKISLIAVGDVSLAGRVNETLRVSDPFEFVEDELLNSDISIGNLECVITDKGKPIRTYEILRASPIAINYLKIFTILGLANNHALDFGIEGMMDTLDALRRNGILTLGAGENYQHAIRPLIIESNSLRIGFISFVYSFVLDEVTLFSTLQRARQFNRHGPARYFKKDVLSWIQKLKEKTDYIIASIHWGKEYIDYPSPPQRSLAEKLIDNGVDVIFGHHPHVIRGIQKYRNGLVFYSLGNFIFDLSLVRQPFVSLAKNGLMVRLSLSTRGISGYRLIPISVDCQPTKLAEEGSFQKYIQDISRPLSYSHAEYYKFWYEHAAKPYLEACCAAVRESRPFFYGLMPPHWEKLYAGFIRGLIRSKC